MEFKLCGASVVVFRAPQALKTCAKDSEEAEQISVFCASKLAQGDELSGCFARVDEGVQLDRYLRRMYDEFSAR